MTEEQKREDLRITKTRRVIVTTLFKLANTCSFKKLTVNRLCNEAQISRATFYSHFEDKYDLLRYALNSLAADFPFDELTYEKAKSFTEKYITDNKAVIRNIIKDADRDTIEIMYNFLLSFVKAKDTAKTTSDPRCAVFSNIFAGGIIFYLSWQIKNRFPADVPIVNKHMFELLKTIFEWFGSECEVPYE